MHPRAWRHWLDTFENFIESLQRPKENLDKLRILINFVVPEIYKLFCDSDNYDEAIAKLKAAYVETPNEILQDILYCHESKGQKNLLMSTCVYSLF